MQFVELEEVSLELGLRHLVVHPLELEVALYLALELRLLQGEDDHFVVLPMKCHAHAPHQAHVSTRRFGCRWRMFMTLLMVGRGDRSCSAATS